MKKFVRGFTLVEMLVVMAILAFTFGAFLQMVRNASYAHLANNAARASLNLLRTTKHQSMLIRRSPSTKWVFGTGLRFGVGPEGNWIISRIRYVDTGTTSIFELYRPYPTSLPTDSAIMEFESGGVYTLRDKLVLDPHVELQLYRSTSLDNAAAKSSFTCDEFYIIFESLTGIPHWYCKQSGNWHDLTVGYPAIYIKFNPSASVLKVTNEADIYMAPEEVFNL